MAGVILTSLMVTGFVAAMMLLIEYVHVLTGGRLETLPGQSRCFRLLACGGRGGPSGTALRRRNRATIAGGSRIYFASGRPNCSLRSIAVPRRMCRRHGGDHPCTCAMGNLYRFVEPVVLLLLKKKGASYGYDLAGELEQYALTDAEIERGALYRTLRQLEMNGNVVSEWEVAETGPARRVYRLTPQGERHLGEWAVVLDHLASAMNRFVKAANKELAAGQSPSRQPGRLKR